MLESAAICRCSSPLANNISYCFTDYDLYHLSAQNSSLSAIFAILTLPDYYYNHNSNDGEASPLLTP